MTALRATLWGMREPAQKPITAAHRRAAILALPLRPEPLSDEEEAIFQEIKARTQETDLSVPNRKDGWWYYKGRKKESMRRLGENISAWEIESVVNAHAEVLESGAHAVQSDLGEDEVKVVIVAQPGAQPTPESILDFCSGKMAHYAIPRYVEFVDALPKTETHRIQYAALKQQGVTPETWDREAAGYKVEKR